MRFGQTTEGHGVTQLAAGTAAGNDMVRNCFFRPCESLKRLIK
jgi:hypothetical protein